ncbi:mannosyltransferase [Amphichorda felina]
MARLRNALLGLLALAPLALASPKPIADHDLLVRSSSAEQAQTLEIREEKKEPEKPKTPKYFREPGGSLARSHYDIRFFSDEVPYAEHRYVLRDLIRSYLTALHERGVETWLAHGTLLGWWWNGQIMPWDFDLDVQVTNHTLQWLGENLNRTEHTYNATSPDDPTGDTVIAKTYLLDINPHHVDIDRGDAQNIIDARWIDMQNGMFIDITGVREREADRPGVWSCKNKHRYDSQDLWPMRMSTFEGVRARIPYSFQRILSDEYGEKSLVAEEWEGHRWEASIKEWVKMSEEEVVQRKMDAEKAKQDALDAQN